MSTRCPKSFPSLAAANSYLAGVYASFGITDPTLWQEFVANSLVTDASGTLCYACDPDITVPLRAASNNFTDVQDIHLTGLWEQIDIPTFIIHGVDSDVLSQDTIHAMRLLNPRTESVTLAGIGHAPSLMSEDQIRLVKNWLSGSAATMLASGL